jgi:phosphoribosylformylglycinamidine synthase
LLPGALLRNRDLKFICSDVPLQVEDSICKWTAGVPSQILHIPINHNEGNYYCDSDTLESMRANGQIVLRYADPLGAPNGALDNIAGICNERGNVFGLMPHPERVVDGLAGRDGHYLFDTITSGIFKAAA